MSFTWITPYSVRIAVAGAGTMGSGIALAALLADMPVTLFDVSPEMLERAGAYIRGHLDRKNKSQNLNHFTQTFQLEDLAGANVVIEAIPEDLKLKQELFRRLDVICPPPAILATNTSTLPVTAIALAATHPGRVAGLHFFNPAPVLPLVEVVPAAQSQPETVHILLTLAEKLGKTPVVATDTPGFIVNRVARPFYGEALRLLGEGVATHGQIDQIVRFGGGFRMGPFHLMDLIGIDVNLAAMQSMFEQTFGEARYRPHPIQVRMVAQNALGRKTGRGFYDYSGDPVSEPTLPEARQCNATIVLGAGSWVPGLGESARKAGYKVINKGYTQAAIFPEIAIAPSGRKEDLRKQVVEMDILTPANIPILCQTADVTLTEAATWIERPERLVGFDGLFFASGRVATLVPSPTLTPHTRSTVEDFVTSLGRLPIWIEDSPALVLPRVVAMLINEATFAVQDGVANADHIDLAMQLGGSYPRGPLAWAHEIGYEHIVDVLDHLYNEFKDERYRAAYLLRRWARLEQVKG